MGTLLLESPSLVCVFPPSAAEGQREGGWAGLREPAAGTGTARNGPHGVIARSGFEVPGNIALKTPCICGK